MKRKFRLLLPILAACFSLCSCDWIQIGDDDTTSKDYGTFYQGYDLTLRGSDLADELQRLCFAKHTKYISYAQVNTYYKKTSDRDSAEAIKAGSSINQWFYTGKEASGIGTREHVWPCANSASLWEHAKDGSIHDVDAESKYYGAGSDLYHVRTCESYVNTVRGNSKYVDFDDDEFESLRPSIKEYGETNGKWMIKVTGTKANEETGKQEYAQKCEPDDHMKGDIARILLYIWVHYYERGVTPEGTLPSRSTHKYSDVTGKLSLTNVMGYSDHERCLEELKEWNKLDAPSDVEKLRNNTVQKVQGNRNPFVDHPELVDQL